MIDTELADRWRAVRPTVAGVHLDSGACSRQSFAVIEAAAQHARHEAEVGGYVAAEAAGSVLQAGRAAIGSLVGLGADDVAFTTGSGHALDLLLRRWSGERTLACPAGEYGPNLAIMAANGFRVRRLATDPLGRVRVEDAEADLRRDRPALVHLTGVASHRGVAQPIADMVEVCRRVGVPLVLDAAQALGQVDCALGADAVYSSSRMCHASSTRNAPTSKCPVPHAGSSTVVAAPCARSAGLSASRKSRSRTNQGVWQSASRFTITSFAPW